MASEIKKSMKYNGKDVADVVITPKSHGMGMEP